MSKKKKEEYISFIEDGVRWMVCKVCQSEYVQVDKNAAAITCSSCVVQRTLKLWPMDEFFSKTQKKTGRPPGWHWMAEYIDKDGNVFHRGKEQPKLKGTLKPTKVKPRKKKKKLTADEKLFKKAADWKKRLKQKRGNKNGKKHK